MAQFVQKDLGGTLSYEVIDFAPLRWDDSPAPTVVLKNKTGGVIVASQEATTGPSTTLSAAASARQNIVKVASVTGISSDDILVISSSSSTQWEWVTIDSVSAGDSPYVTTRDELKYSYTSGDVLKSCKLSVSISSSEVTQVLQDCRAEWTYSVSSQSITSTSRFHVSVWSPRMTLRDQDILTRNPRAAEQLASRQRLSQLIKDIWERDIMDTLSVRINPAALVVGDDLRQVHLYKVLVEIARMAGLEEEKTSYLEAYQDAWQNFTAQAIVDTDGDGEISDNDIVLPFVCGRVYKVS